MSKPFYKSVTFWFALLYGALQVAGLFGYLDYTPGENVSELVGLVVSVIVFVLRLATHKAIHFRK